MIPTFGRREVLLHGVVALPTQRRRNFHFLPMSFNDGWAIREH
jgi:hypothetical protein